MKNKLIELHMGLHNYQISRDYIMTKTNKLSELENMLERSILASQLELLERASFHRSICSLNFCELEIHAEQKGDTVLIHKKMVTLEPTSKVVVTCAAASPSEISTWHNSLAIQTTANSFLINNSIVTTEQLSNRTLANMMLRPISENEVLLKNFIIHGNNLQCLQDVDFLLNNKPLQCKALQSFSLPINYEIEVNGRKIVQHVISRQGQLINKNWLKEFEVPLSNDNFKLEISTIPVIHPVVDTILLSEAGELSVAKVSILSGGTLLIFFLGCVACCCCCRGYRECACTACTKIFTAVYHICTSESYRLKRANNKLRKSNKQKRKTLEKNIREHELVNQALAALGVNVAETFEQDVEDGNVDRLGPLRNDKVSSLNNVDKVMIVGAEGKLQDTSV